MCNEVFLLWPVETQHSSLVWSLGMLHLILPEILCTASSSFSLMCAEQDSAKDSEGVLWRPPELPFSVRGWLFLLCCFLLNSGRVLSSVWVTPPCALARNSLQAVSWMIVGLVLSPFSQGSLSCAADVQYLKSVLQITYLLFGCVMCYVILA